MESLTFQPNKKGVISGGIISVILCVGLFAYITFEDGECPSKNSLIFLCVSSVVVVLVYTVTVFSIVRSVGYRTKIEVSQQGFAVVDPKRWNLCSYHGASRSICVLAWKETSIAIIGSTRRYSAFLIRT